MEKYDVIIIGSGLGGLQCGYILSKHGLKVCILEKNRLPGGCLQSFHRGNNYFDTGFHYVGGLDNGEPLHRIFNYFKLMHLPWRRLDENGFDEILISGESFFYVNGYERFVDSLAKRFPHQKTNLKKYTDLLRTVSETYFDFLHKPYHRNSFVNSLFTHSAYDYLCTEIDDPLLRNVLSGASLKMELNPTVLPLYTFAQINSAFICSAWRLQGGGSQIVNSLINSIHNYGGEIITNAEVTKLIESNNIITEVELSDQTRLKAKYFISDIHPAATITLIENSLAVKKIFRQRITSLDNTFGFFTVHIAFKPDSIPYLNRNIFIYSKNNVWDVANYKMENLNTCAMISFQPNKVKDVGADVEYTRNIDILSPMYMQEIEKWINTSSGRRGVEYEEYKTMKTEKLLNMINAEYRRNNKPEFFSSKVKLCIENIYTSTLLTYRDYIGTPDGSAYGIRKKYDQLLTTLLSPRTPVPNLFFTGQNINIHGVSGVSVSSFYTCAEIIGIDVATQGL